MKRIKKNRKNCELSVNKRDMLHRIMISMAFLTGTMLIYLPCFWL
jgi:hypothetical protein